MGSQVPRVRTVPGWRGGQGSADWGGECRGYHAVTPNSEVRRWGPAGEGDAVGAVPAAGRSRPDHSPVGRCGGGRGRGGEREGRQTPPTALGGCDPDRSRPGPAFPACDVTPVDHSAAAPAGSPGAHWPVGSGRRERAGGRETPRRAVAMDALAPSNHGSRETCLVAEVSRGSAAHGRGRGDSPPLLRHLNANFSGRGLGGPF